MMKPTPAADSTIEEQYTRIDVRITLGYIPFLSVPDFLFHHVLMKAIKRLQPICQP